MQEKYRLGWMSKETGNAWIAQFRQIMILTESKVFSKGIIEFISVKDQWLKRSNRKAECHNWEDLSASMDTTSLCWVEVLLLLSNWPVIAIANTVKCVQKKTGRDHSFTATPQWSLASLQFHLIYLFSSSLKFYSQQTLYSVLLTNRKSLNIICSYMHTSVGRSMPPPWLFLVLWWVPSLRFIFNLWAMSPRAL